MVDARLLYFSENFDFTYQVINYLTMRLKNCIYKVTKAAR